MFGYLMADAGTLSEEELSRYRSCYCGLCRSLKALHGELSRLTLNYDMTFLSLLLSSLYEPEEEQGDGICIRHPIKAQHWVRSEASDYAADMNMALAYLKKLDDWQDEKSVVALFQSKLLRPSYEKVREKYPVQCSSMEREIEALREIENSSELMPDEAADCFGRLMSGIFVLREDMWSQWLRRFAHSLGRCVYLMDAVMDLDRDIRSGSYNPFADHKGRADNEQVFRDILKMELGECLYYFDRLPLVQDSGIMKNVLCRGIWARFENKYTRKDS